MYEKVLNEKAVAGDIVDRLRDITNAPLSSCIEAARSILDSLSDYVHEEPFTRIASAIHSFEMDVDNCRDSKMFDMLITRLEVIFHEKEELSYSVSQDDEQLIEYLSLLTDTVSKTDPKIACNAVSRHDFSWLNSLINIFQMDQNDRVHEAVVQCIDVLTATCPQLAPYFVESKLLVVIAHKVPVSSKLLSTIDKLSLALLARLFSTSALPPLSHFDTIDTSFVERILGHFVEHQDLILQCLIAINYSVPHVDENPVMTALSSSRIPLFGEIFTSNLNKNFSEQGLRLLLDILKCDRLIDDLFYSNDLAVLKQVLSRELVNDESEKIRSLCLDAIESCALNGIRCQDIRHAVEQSSVEEAKKLRVLKVLDSH